MCILVLVSIAYVSGENDLELKVVMEKLENEIKNNDQLIIKEVCDKNSNNSGCIEWHPLIKYDPCKTEDPGILKIKYVINKI